MSKLVRGSSGGDSSSLDDQETRDESNEPDQSAGSNDRLDAPGGVDTGVGDQRDRSNEPDRSARSADRLEAPGGPDTSVGDGSQTNNDSSTDTSSGSSDDTPDGPPTEPEDSGMSESDSGSGLVNGLENAVQSARDFDQEVRNGYRDLRTDAQDTFRDVTNTDGVTEAVAKRRQKGYQQTREFTVDTVRHATGKEVDRGVYGNIQDVQEQFDENNVKTGPGPVLGGFSTAGGSIVKVGKNARGYLKAAKGVEAGTVRGTATGERVVGGAVQSGEFVVKGTNSVVNAVKTGAVGTVATAGSEISIPEHPTAGETSSEIGTPNEAPGSESANGVDVPREAPGSQSHAEVGVPSETPGRQQQGEIGIPEQPGDTGVSEVGTPAVETGAAVPQPGNNQQNTGPGSLPSPNEPSISEEEASTPAVNPQRSGPGYITNGRVSAGELSGDASKNLAEDVNVDQPSVKTDFTGVRQNAVGTSGGVTPGDAVNTDSPPENDSPPKFESPPKNDSPPTYDSPPRYDSPPETKTPPETTPETGTPTDTGTPNTTKNPNVPQNTTYTPNPPISPPRTPRVPDLDGDVDTGKRRRRKFDLATDTFEADVYTPEEIQSGEAFKGLD